MTDEALYEPPQGENSVIVEFGFGLDKDQPFIRGCDGDATNVWDQLFSKTVVPSST